MQLDPEAVYLQLRRLVASMPDVGNQQPMTPEVHQWLGRAVALVEMMRDATDVVQLKAAADGLHTGSREYNDHCAQKITSIVHRALARAEIFAPASAQGAFIAAGDTLNAFAAVAKVLGRAKSDLLLVDSYADHTIISDFAVTAPDGVTLRILAANKEARKLALRPAMERWVSQFGSDRPLEVRVAQDAVLHDRLILVDGTEAWFAGQSFNGMAKRSHTSIERSDPELATMKIAAYEAHWQAAEPL